MTFLLHGPCLSLPGLSPSVVHQIAAKGLLAGLLGCGLVPSKLPPGLLSDGAQRYVSLLRQWVPWLPFAYIWAFDHHMGLQVLTICADPTVTLNSLGPTCPRTHDDMLGPTSLLLTLPDSPFFLS